MDEEDIITLLVELDTDGDGKVSEQEFVKGYEIWRSNLDQRTLKSSELPAQEQTPSPLDSVAEEGSGVHSGQIAAVDTEASSPRGDEMAPAEGTAGQTEVEADPATSLPTIAKTTKWKSVSKLALGAGLGAALKEGTGEIAKPEVERAISGGLGGVAKLLSGSSMKRSALVKLLCDVKQQGPDSSPVTSIETSPTMRPSETVSPAPPPKPKPRSFLAPSISPPRAAGGTGGDEGDAASSSGTQLNKIRFGNSFISRAQKAAQTHRDSLLSPVTEKSEEVAEGPPRTPLGAKHPLRILRCTQAVPATLEEQMELSWARVLLTPVDKEGRPCGLSPLVEIPLVRLLPCFGCIPGDIDETRSAVLWYSEWDHETTVQSYTVTPEDAPEKECWYEMQDPAVIAVDTNENRSADDYEQKVTSPAVPRSFPILCPIPKSAQPCSWTMLPLH